jgi:ABC-type nitrate/sulfonate/bicarbonate transport system permease component
LEEKFEMKKTSGIILILFLLGLWELFSQYEIVNSVFLPPFSKVISTFFVKIFDTNFLTDVLMTIIRCLSGFMMASIIGILIGLLMGQSKKIYYLFEPLVEILRPIPSAAVIPVAILFLGIGDEMKIFVIFFACLWPILINSMDGARNIDPLIIDTAHTFDLRPKEFLFKIIIPASTPGIITGMRISLAISLILSVTVEMIAGNDGLGFYILDMERSFQFPEMYAGIVFIGILGYILNNLFLRLTSGIMKWHRGFISNI